ncbi:CYTH domain-containing protein [Atlantibacter subterraneus]|uniref:CYTH domain-containing protein n=1 Tax=Atlantibacter subterraneus TaxID=255519 RepID=UPI0029640170|nr:inorganic triphosphatase [Atlantibacter subterranea]MDW2744806.1 inorganic triphosphatase [Atlantibacter subterranea]
MAQEIELKFIVQPEALEAVRNVLNGLSGEHHAPRQLHNVYYETPDNQLRNHGTGLRVRGDNGRYEMTVKTAGRVVGGVHQHPEYNVALDSAELDLARFPADIWPDGLTADALQSQVRPLFSTDFQREKWVVTHGESRIELALDRGEVKAGEHSEPLCELEMELLEGQLADILKLARQLVAVPGLRQGSLSKAARGYHLAQGNALRAIQPLTVIAMQPKATVEQGLQTALEAALSHWLYHEELWVRGNTLAKSQVQQAIGLVRHILTLFGGVVPRKASARLRDLLTQCEVSLVSDASAETLAFGSEISTAKLALTEWLLTQGWQPFIDEKDRRKLDDSFKRYADIHLSRHAAELKQAFLQSCGERYRDQLPRLYRELDAIRTLAGVYPGEAALDWIDTWDALRHAIENGLRSDIESLRHEAIAQSPFWLHSGKK